MYGAQGHRQVGEDGHEAYGIGDGDECKAEEDRVLQQREIDGLAGTRRRSRRMGYVTAEAERHRRDGAIKQEHAPPLD